MLSASQGQLTTQSKLVHEKYRKVFLSEAFLFFLLYLHFICGKISLMYCCVNAVKEEEFMDLQFLPPWEVLLKRMVWQQLGEMENKIFHHLTIKKNI